MAEFTKLFGSIKKLTEKTKNRENVWSVEEIELFLVQSNSLVNNEYQERSEGL